MRDEDFAGTFSRNRMPIADDSREPPALDDALTSQQT
jgi:hypothetical protein